MVTEAPTVRGQRRQFTNPEERQAFSISRSFNIVFSFFLQNLTDHECDGEAEHGVACPPGTKPRAPTDNQPEINYFFPQFKERRMINNDDHLLKGNL